jgi:hypothetical protein
MKQPKISTLRYALLPVIVINLTSACGTLVIEEMAPTQGGLLRDRPAIVQPVTTGEFAGVVDGAQTGHTREGYTDCPQIQWDPSAAQVAASIAIGAVWYYLAVRDTSAEEIRSINDRIAVAIAGGGV